MKFNWGMGIALFYSIFAAALFFQVYKSTQYDNSLVVEDYYAKDIAYQEQYDKLENTMALSQDIKFVKNRETAHMELHFPKETQRPTGEILFFNPAHAKLDFTVKIDADGENVQAIPLEKLRSGMWKVKVDWQANGKKFYSEKIVNI